MEFGRLFTTFIEDRIGLIGYPDAAMGHESYNLVKHEEDRKIAFEAGMNGHLAKPYDIGAIMQTLSEILK